MKTRKLTLIVLSALILVGAGATSIGVTYAAYANTAMLNQDVGVEGKTRKVFLTVNQNITITQDDALIYCRYWEDGHTGVWERATAYRNGHYFFNVPANSGDNYNRILFARINPANAANPESGIWNQTEDLTLNFAEYNRFNIESYDSVNQIGGNDKLVGSWTGIYNPFSS